MLFTEAVEGAGGFVSSCGNITDVRSIVLRRPQEAVTDLSQVSIIADTDVVFNLPNSSLYHNNR